MTLLEDLDWVEVVAEAGSAEEAIRVVTQHKPDVVVMDIRLPGESGIEACKTITVRWPETRVIMLTSSADDEMIFKALQAGASGYVLKQVGNQALISALDAARKGASLLDPVVTQRVITRVREAEKQQQALAFRDLSERELEVLARLSEGKSNAEIAAQLSLSEKTVGHHVSAILSKLNLSNRIEAAIYAVRHHIEEHLPEQR
jgi:DNA-binding NarL/FixJ family response regulator